MNEYRALSIYKSPSLHKITRIWDSWDTKLNGQKQVETDDEQMNYQKKIWHNQSFSLLQLHL